MKIQLPSDWHQPFYPRCDDNIALAYWHSMLPGNKAAKIEKQLFQKVLGWSKSFTATVFLNS